MRLLGRTYRCWHCSVKEIMNDTMSEIKHGSFLRRVRRYIKESEARLKYFYILLKNKLNVREQI